MYAARVIGSLSPPACVPSRWALTICTLCAQGVLAQEAGQSEEPSLNQPAAVASAAPPSVIIEAPPIETGPTIELLLQRFRAALAEDRARALPSERHLASGATELQTRYGRFCINPLPAYLYSDLAGTLTLASRCAMF